MNDLETFGNAVAHLHEIVGRIEKSRKIELSNLKW